MTQGTTVCRYAYDGEGNRTKRLDANGTVHYVGDYERNLGVGAPATDVVTKHYVVQMGGQTKLVALRKNGVLCYAGTDHLGSTVRLTDSSGNPIANSRQRYGVWRAGVSRKPERLEADEFGPRYAWAR